MVLLRRSLDIEIHSWKDVLGLSGFDPCLEVLHHVLLEALEINRGPVLDHFPLREQEDMLDWKHLFNSLVLLIRFLLNLLLHRLSVSDSLLLVSDIGVFLSQALNRYRLLELCHSIG